MVQRHVPERTCIACRQARPKRALVRIVRTTAGNVVADVSGKLSGRGAYLCHEPACWQKGLRKDALARALKTTIAETDRAALERFAADLTGGAAEDARQATPGRAV